MSLTELRASNSSHDRPHRPAFLITIDTEGDNLWSRPAAATTRNSRHLPRFQSLCERYGLLPTYLTDWDMVMCPVYGEFAGDVLRRGTAEIGMHLHAWSTPPLEPLTDDDGRHLPYLIEYPEHLIREKVRRITDQLEETFNVKMKSHRAGRWAFNELYASVLLDNGYCVDCSVTPHVSHRSQLGSPTGSGGTDYRGFPEAAYWLDVTDLRRPGTSTLLEIPVTIIRPTRWAPVESVAAAFRRVPIARRAVGRWLPECVWLRPNGHNRRALLEILEVAQARRCDYVEFMLHSSEFMPGGSPTFAREADVERLYDDLEALFSDAARSYVGMTLTGYHDRFRAADAYGAAGALVGSKER